MGDLVKIGAVWKNRNQQGQTFLSGKLGDATLLILPNREKTEGGKEPDYLAFVAIPKPKPTAHPPATEPGDDF